MNMPRTIEELSEIDKNAGVVINGVDNANLMSVDSTEPIETKPEEEKLSGEDLDASDKNTEDEGKIVTELDTEEKNAKNKEEKQGEEDSSPPTKPESQPEDSKNVQKRIGKLTKKMRTAERERDLKEDENTELKRKLEEMSSRIDEMSSKILDSNKPKKEDFDDEDDYIEALAEWKMDTKLGKFSKSAEEKTVDNDKNDEQEALKETYYGLDDAMDSGRKKYENFDKLVLDENLIISPEVTQIVLDTDTPEDVMYYLASNPKESERISKLDPIRAAKEIGKVEIKLEKFEKEESSKPKKKYSKAPSPITSVRTDGVTEKDPNKMSMKEYRAWREGNQ